MGFSVLGICNAESVIGNQLLDCAEQDRFHASLAFFGLGLPEVGVEP